MVLESFISVLNGTNTPEEQRVLYPAYKIVDIAILDFLGGKLIIFSKESMSLQSKKYKINIVIIIVIRQGTINEFTSIKPLVPLRRNIIAQKSIIKEPRILGI